MEAQKKEKVAKLEKKQTETDVKNIKEGMVTVEEVEAKKEKELEPSKGKLKDKVADNEKIKNSSKNKAKVEDKQDIIKAEKKEVAQKMVDAISKKVEAEEKEEKAKKQVEKAEENIKKATSETEKKQA